jgi:ubiquinone/menaquinone biosynthesis C-methylase UbiE
MFEYDEITKRYNEKADKYDKYCNKANTGYGHIEKMRRECVFSLISRKGKLLEVGCGTGYYLERLTQNECFGIDISKEMLKQCKSKSVERVFLGNINHLMFRDKNFDIILCVNTFQYLPYPTKALTEMSRVLKDNGEIILTSENWLTPRVIPHYIYKVLQKREFFGKRYTLFYLKKMFDTAGLRISDIKGFNFLLCRSNHKYINKKILNAFGNIERNIRSTSLKYFANEFAIRLTKE